MQPPTQDKHERPAGGRVAPIEVVLCTFNGERYIREQVDSVLRQSILPQRLSIHDDASTDGTRDVVEDIIRHHKGPVEIVLHANARNLGYVKNFEQAIRSATLDFIALCDQDDIWNDDKLETLFPALDDGAAIVFSDALLVDENARTLGHTLWEAIGLTPERLASFGERTAARRLLLQQSYVTGAALLMRRSLVAALPEFPTAAPHDYWMAIVAAEVSGIRPVRRVLYRYRQHGRNVIGQAKRGVWGNIVNAFRRADSRYDTELATYRSIAQALQGQSHLEHLHEPYRAKAEFLQARKEAVGSGPRGLPRLGRILRAGEYGRFCRTGAAMFVKDTCVLAARTFRRPEFR